MLVASSARRILQPPYAEIYGDFGTFAQFEVFLESLLSFAEIINILNVQLGI